jgi:hypothetical protein
MYAKISGSFDYCFRINGVTFIQLHNYPHYKASWSRWLPTKRDYSIFSNYSFVKCCIYQAKARKDLIIVNMHNSYFDKTDDDSKQFMELFNREDVFAIFSGHVHVSCEEIDTSDGMAVQFRSGSASYQDFLSLSFDFQKKEALIHRWKSENTDKDKMDTYKSELIKEINIASVPVMTGWVKVKNKGGYVARYILQYLTESGEFKSFKVEKAVGQMQYWEIPDGASNITLTAHAVTRSDNIFEKDFGDTAPNDCFITRGSLFEPRYEIGCDKL